jgi:RimJ/RimL family protein N-acetyltransferase
MNRAAVPAEIRTERLLLRPWRGDDAPALLPILEQNREHLGPWIPARVAEPAPPIALRERLDGFAGEFEADREWRYAVLLSDESALLGEMGLFPRSATSRVQFDDADRVELGYWLRRDHTGNGYVIEAARALLAVARSFPRFTHAEIRCDARNLASVAIPRRLGFVHSDSVMRDGGVELQVWTLSLNPRK